MPDSEERGNNDPKPSKPSGDDPRSGDEMRSLLHSDDLKRSSKSKTDK